MDLMQIFNMTASRQMSRYLSFPFVGDSTEFRSRTSAVLATAGVDLKKVLKVRDDGRCVFIVHHPVWKTCILKTTNSVQCSVAGLANLSIARFVRDAPAPIFPQIYDMTADYTVEEYIEGTPFRQWVEQRFMMPLFMEYLTELKEWSETRGPWSGSEMLLPIEVKSIMKVYIEKCVSQLRYQKLHRQIRGLHKLFRDRTEILSRLQFLADEAERIKIPRGIMCGDMSNVNLIVDESKKRIYMIDYEFMGPGNIGFDCAYLLTSLEKLPRNQAETKEIASFIHSDKYAGSSERAAFFSVYNSVLTQISQTVYGQIDRDCSAPVT